MSNLPSSAEVLAEINRLKIQGYDLIAQRDFSQSELNRTNNKITELMGLYQQTTASEADKSPKEEPAAKAPEGTTDAKQEEPVGEDAPTDNSEQAQAQNAGSPAE